MRTIKLGNKIYRYESFWRSSITSRTLDYNGKVLPYPKINIKWQGRNLFLGKLILAQKNLKKKGKFIEYEKEEFKNCLICGKKNVTKILYDVNRTRWEDGLVHYIEEHKIKPSDEFIDIIFKYMIDPRVLSRKKTIKGTQIVKYNKVYLKLDRNQILIMDALMQHGSKRSYIDDKNNKVYRYSEHAGLLDFDQNKLEKIIVSGNTTRVDEYDDEIYLPNNIKDAFDYEYIFHTHPATPKPGGRVKYGVLYEFPSISDMFHFMDHYNNGKTQGSIIIAAEGMYVIKKKKHDNNNININEDKFYRECVDKYKKVQNNAIKKYGIKFTDNGFYSKIAQDKTYINELNKIFNKYKMHVDFYSRVKNSKNRWIIDTIYLPVYAIE